MLTKNVASVTNLVESLSQTLLSRPMNEDEAEIALYKQGWFLINSEGTFSNIYGSPCGVYVLRVAFSMPEDEDCFPFHATHAIFEKDNPYLPNIYWHVHSAEKYIEARMNLTLMEKLTNISMYKGAAGLPNDFKIVNEAMPHSADNVEIPIQAFENPTLAKTLYTIKENMQRYNLHSDIKPQNVLMRGQQVVITDPYMGA